MARTMRRTAALRALMQAFRGSGTPESPALGRRLSAVPRMLSMSLNGAYPGLSRGRMVLAALGLLYIISPVDLMPEALLWVFGLGDDALVAAWVAGAVLGEAELFLAWERSDRPTGTRIVPGEVINRW